MARVLVVDDHRVLAEALAFRLALEEGISHARVATSTTTFVREFDAFSPDVVVTDLELGPRSGLDVLRHVQSTRPSVKTIALVSSDAPEAAAAAIRLGALGVLSKFEATSRLVDAVRGVAQGETHIDPQLLTGVIRELTNPDTKSQWEDRVDRLTDREREVLQLIVAGRDRAQVAEILYLSVNTVRTHVKNILAKLEVHSTLEAVGVALRAGVEPRSAA